MSAGNETPDRIKKLFSSFLTTKEHELSIDSSRKINEDSSPNRTNTGELSLPDARNKRLFQERVDTFSPLTWFAKPLDLSPLICAQYGWQNTDKDMLQCVNCRAFICGQLPTAVDTQNYRDSCNKLKKELVEGHGKLCKWSSSPCPVSFMYVPYHDKGEILSNFLFRITSLQCAKIPKISFKSIEEKGVTEQCMMSYASTIGSNSNLETVPSLLTIVCALCGWHYSESQNDILQCNFCCRKLGLWSYQSQCENTEQIQKTITPVESDTFIDTTVNGNSFKSVTNGSVFSDQTKSIHKKDLDNEKSVINAENGNGAAEDIGAIDEDINKTNDKADKDDKNNTDCDGPVKKRPRLESQSFDPVTEHRYWCPWLQTDSLNVTSSSTCTKEKETSPDGSPVKFQTTKSCNEGEPAWLKVTKSLFHKFDDNDHSVEERPLKRSPQVEGLRHLRKVLRECTSPTK